MLALYHLRFYELDQSIAVGERKNFNFFLDPYLSQIDTLDTLPSGMLLVFYNSLSCGERKIMLDCTIQRIHHFEIGDICRVQAEGFEYRIETTDDIIVVDAEERAGDVVLGTLRPAGWLFTVELDVHAVVRLG